MKKKKKNAFKVFVLNIIAMAAVAIGLSLLVLGWLDSYTLHGKVIEVPALGGVHIDQAAELLRTNNLDFEVIDYKYKKNARENEVVEQHPLAGSMVKKGRKIQLTLSSSNEPMQPLPDIIDNCSLREAEARLLAAGFNLSTGVRISGEADWVYSVIMGNDTLENGAKVPMGATLTLVVGNGEESIKETEPIMEDSWFE